MSYHLDNQLQRGVVAAIAALQNSDDQSIQPEPTIQHTLGDCLKSCGSLPIRMCYSKCLMANSFSSQPHSQISEKLEDIASNLLVESEQLSFIAGDLSLMGI